ncbi:Glycosyl transferase, group 2 family protein [Thermodesulfovibrio sp. N1]|uniref:glycosyltransferase family 2 protein n=1 Tax=Thermodesulfovibrio sp. N1 TaxID=1871110 RepID=UPI00083A7525|nr:glycosyltransferase family 2 protein [Thermodesulfovibrio sp. N1]ODA43320.1 Glycosyl transferase, group 2 family protein [Thermodesulfovibrio sp. N1]
MELLKSILLGFNYFVGFYYFLLNSFYTLFLLVSFWAIIEYLRNLRFYNFQELKVYPQLPPVSIIIPVYNEKDVVLRTINSALSLDYPHIEVIIVNDGSTDETLGILIEKFQLKKLPFFIYRKRIETSKIKGVYRSQLYPNFLLVDKERGGKFDALNCGLHFAQNPYICTVDADSVLERDAFLRLGRKIIESDIPVVALGGVVRVLNGVKLEEGKVLAIELPKKSLPIFQIVEYIRGFLFGRLGWERLKGTFILSGAFSLFNKEALFKVGGFNGYTVTEDFEIIVRLHKYFRQKKEPYYIGFIPDPVCWTEVPETLSDLSKQRRRWHLGLLQTLWMYKNMFLNPKYGRIGCFVIPFYLLEALGAVVETLGYPVVFLSYFVGILNFEFLLLFLILALGYGVFLSVGGIFLEEMSFRRYPRWSQVFRLLLYGVLENFGYRQFNSLLRFQATFQFLFGYKKWEIVKKSGRLN